MCAQPATLTESMCWNIKFGNVHVFTYISSGSMNDFFLAGDPTTAICKLSHISFSSDSFSVLSFFALDSSQTFLVLTSRGWCSIVISQRTAWRKSLKAIADSSASKSSSGISSLASSDWPCSVCLCCCIADSLEKKLFICCAVLYSSGLNKGYPFLSLTNFISWDTWIGSALSPLLDHALNFCTK